MADILWPLHIVPNTMPWQIIDSTAAFNSPTSGYTRTASTFGVRRWGTSINKDNLRTTDRSYITGLIAALRGRANRIYLPCFMYVQRGAFPAGELLANNTFDNGTTGWSSYGSDGATLTVNNRVLRATEIGYHSYGVQKTSITGIQYASYAFRAMMIQGRGAGIASPYVDDGTVAQQAFGASGQSSLFTTPALTSLSTTLNVGAYMGPTPGPYLAGDFFTVPYLSLARCLVVDNPTNSLLQSDALDNAAWTRTGLSTIQVNSTVAPDGTSTADAFTENSSTSQHGVLQAFTVPAAAADYFFCVAVRTGSRSFVSLYLKEMTSSTLLNQYFNLTTHAVGATGSTGASWANRRAFAIDLGNTWTLCCLGGRKTNAATSIQAHIYSATADGTDSYLGTAVNAIHVWRATAAQSSSPVRLVQTTSVAVAGTQTGSSIYVKGGGSVLLGALLAGDMAEIVLPNFSQLVRLTADLDLDATGAGYLQFEPALRQAPADGAAIIVNNPMGRFMSADGTIEWDNKPGPGGNPLTDTSINFVESVQ